MLEFLQCGVLVRSLVYALLDMALLTLFPAMRVHGTAARYGVGPPISVVHGTAARFGLGPPVSVVPGTAAKGAWTCGRPAGRLSGRIVGKMAV